MNSDKLTGPQVMSTLTRISESIPTPTAHAVGLSSGLTGLALYAELAKHLTALVGLLAALLAVLGACAYGAFWVLKTYAKWKRIKKGDYSE
jgi:hypothetical protein